MGSKDVLNGFLGEDNSKFFSLLDGQSKVVRYMSVRPHVATFDGQKSNVLRYEFEEEGKIKVWDRPSRQLAALMRDIPDGSWIEISRQGEKNQTRYQVSLVPPEEQPDWKE